MPCEAQDTHACCQLTVCLCSHLQILHDMHKGGRIHRDIKPENMIVSWKDSKVTVSLIDWAGSRLESESRHPTWTCFDMCPASRSNNRVCCMFFAQGWHLNEPMSATSSMVLMQPMCTAVKPPKQHKLEASRQMCIKQQQWLCHCLHCMYSSV